MRGHGFYDMVWGELRKLKTEYGRDEWAKANPDYVKFLKENEAAKDALFSAVFDDNVALAEWLIDERIGDPNRNTSISTMLGSCTSVEMIDVFIKGGASGAQLDEYRWTPLMEHVRKNRQDCVIRLLVLQEPSVLATIDDVSHCERSALHFACEFWPYDRESRPRHVKMIKALLQAGANSTLRAYCGDPYFTHTPLGVLKRQTHLGICELAAIALLEDAEEEWRKGGKQGGNGGEGGGAGRGGGSGTGQNQCDDARLKAKICALANKRGINENTVALVLKELYGEGDEELLEEEAAVEQDEDGNKATAESAAELKETKNKMAAAVQQKEIDPKGAKEKVAAAVGEKEEVNKLMDDHEKNERSAGKLEEMKKDLDAARDRENGGGEGGGGGGGGEGGGEEEGGGEGGWGVDAMSMLNKELEKADAKLVETVNAAAREKEEDMNKLVDENTKLAAEIEEMKKKMAAAALEKENELEKVKEKLAAELEEAKAKLAVALEEKNDSEEEFARLASEYYAKKKTLNECKEMLLEEGKDEEGPLVEVLLVESFGVIYCDEVQGALAGEGLSKALVDGIFKQLGGLLTNTDFNVLVRKNGEIVGEKRALVQETLERVLEEGGGASGGGRRVATISERGTTKLIDLFLKKRRELEERNASGMYPVDVLWHKKEKRDLTLPEAIQAVIGELKKAKEEGGGGGGGGKKRKRG